MEQGCCKIQAALLFALCIKIWYRNEEAPFKAAGDIHTFECADVLEQLLSGLICPFPFLGLLILEKND